MYGRKDTWHGDERFTNPLCAQTAEGRKLRKQIADGNGTEWERYVPKEARAFIRMGRKKMTDKKYPDWQKN